MPCEKDRFVKYLQINLKFSYWNILKTKWIALFLMGFVLLNLLHSVFSFVDHFLSFYLFSFGHHYLYCLSLFFFYLWILLVSSILSITCDHVYLSPCSSSIISSLLSFLSTGSLDMSEIKVKIIHKIPIGRK